MRFNLYQSKYLRTVRPLLEDAQYKRLEQSAIEFQNGVGRRLQRYLTFKSFISSNYVSDWWEEYVYLRGRSPIMVNSNFYALDTVFKVFTENQAARAATAVTAAFMYRKELDNEELEPIMVQNMVPLCSRQYERQFNTTRVPGETHDRLVHYNDSKHIAVYSKGKWYKLFTYYKSQNLNAKELEM
jgi:carnitine O-palmitoyltransferase 1, liver isoform